MAEVDVLLFDAGCAAILCQVLRAEMGLLAYVARSPRHPLPLLSAAADLPRRRLAVFGRYQLVGLGKQFWLGSLSRFAPAGWP